MKYLNITVYIYHKANEQLMTRCYIIVDIYLLYCIIDIACSNIK